MIRRKERWRAEFRRNSPNIGRFSYRGTADGKTEFFRHNIPFDWGPLEVDREAARAFVDQMNKLTGGKVNTEGRAIADRFITAIRAGKHKPKGK